MCSQEGVANVLRELIEARVPRLKELKEKWALMGSAITTMELAQAKDTARLKELEDDGDSTH